MLRAGGRTAYRMVSRYASEPHAGRQGAAPAAANARRLRSRRPQRTRRPRALAPVRPPAQPRLRLRPPPPPLVRGSASPATIVGRMSTDYRRVSEFLRQIVGNRDQADAEAPAAAFRAGAAGRARRQRRRAGRDRRALEPPAQSARVARPRRRSSQPRRPRSLLPQRRKLHRHRESSGRRDRPAARQRPVRARRFLRPARDHGSGAGGVAFARRAADHRSGRLHGGAAQRRRDARARLRVRDADRSGPVRDVGGRLAREVPRGGGGDDEPRQADRHARDRRGQSRLSRVRVHDGRCLRPEHGDDRDRRDLSATSTPNRR